MHGSDREAGSCRRVVVYDNGLGERLSVEVDPLATLTFRREVFADRWVDSDGSHEREGCVRSTLKEITIHTQVLREIIARPGDSERLLERAPGDIEDALKQAIKSLATDPRDTR